MRWVKRILLFLLILVLGLAAYGVFTVRRSFPQTTGTLEVAGLNDTVEVLRDGLGVPHIYASNRHDMFFAEGFTHAQDRFWQMDFWRHIGAGRLSEMFGASQVDADMFLRSLGFRSIAEQEWAGMGSPGREILEAYAQGVNAYLDTRSGAELSLEYAILPLQNSGYEIEAWSPTDTLMWAKVMSWDLAGNMEAEIGRAVLGSQLTPEQVDQLYPPMPADKPVIVETGQRTADRPAVTSLPRAAISALARAGDAAELTAGLTGGGFEGIGSNNWVVSGSMTRSGLPLMANDTHLAIQMPSIWYEVGLHCVGSSPGCPIDLVGYSFAGTPGVITGHNAHHAWGVTNEAADTQDLFIEKVNPDDPDQYEVDGDWVDFEVRTETIEVAGDDDVEYQVRRSRHGPIISGTFLDDGEFDGSSVVETPDDYVVSLAWQTLEPSTIVDAIIGIDLAASYEEFLAAAAKWDIAPQNLVYADVEGNIAYHATGEIPVRATGDGRFPVAGWSSEHDWVDVIPFDELPGLFNPPQGYIESANQAVLRPGELPFLGADSAHGYRAGRISELIEQQNDHDVTSMQQIQLDTKDDGAALVVPYLLSVDDGGDAAVTAVQERLRGWGSGNAAYQVTGRSAGAAIYMSVWRHLLANIFHDDLPEDYWPTGGSRWFEVMKHILGDPNDPFWDDANTGGIETMDDILIHSMRDAHSELTDLLGADMAGWTWGSLHIARFENQTFGQSGIGPIEWLFNRTASPDVGGSESIVNAVGWNTAISYDVDWVPSQRMVVDLADLDSSTFVHTTGQSGHAFNGNYDSMIEMWAHGEYGPMPWTREMVDEVTVDTLTLAPRD